MSKPSSDNPANPQLWLMSSPPLDVTSGEALNRARRAAENGAAGVVYLDYGADMTLDRIGPCAAADCSHQAGVEQGCGAGTAVKLLMVERTEGQ